MRRIAAVAAMLTIAGCDFQSRLDDCVESGACADLPDGAGGGSTGGGSTGGGSTGGGSTGGGSTGGGSTGGGSTGGGSTGGGSTGGGSGGGAGGSGGGEPAVLLAPADLDWGDVAIDDQVERRLSLTNDGGANSGPLTAQVMGSDFAITANPCTSLMPGQSCELSLVFAPDAGGPKQGALEVSESSALQLGTTLRGTAVAPLSWSPDGGAFGPLAARAPAQAMTFALTSRWSTARSISVSAGPPPFVVLDAGTCTGMLAAMATCQVRVGFAPWDAGFYTGTLSATSGAHTLATGLSGTSFQPGFVVFNQTQIDFGVVDAGTLRSASVQLTNAGMTTVGPISLSVPAPFGLDAGLCAAGLDAGNSCLLTVSFAPTDAGAIARTVVATHSTGMASLPVNGVGQLARTLQVISSEGLVSSNPGGINCPSTCSAQFVHAATPVTVVLTATADAGRRFVSWSNCPSPSGNTCTVSMSANRAVSASWAVQQHQVRVWSSHPDAGTVVFTPGGTPCGQTCATFDLGTRVRLSPRSRGYLFHRFGPPCSGASSADCIIDVTSDLDIDAGFSGPHNLIFATTGSALTGGVTQADGICAAQAAASGLPDQNFRAWLSTNNPFVHAPQRFSPGGWVRLDGRPFIASLNSAFQPIHPPRFRANGVEDSSAIATGTGVSGPTLTCNDWTGSGSFTFGNPSSGSSLWTEMGSFALCAMPPLYCMGNLGGLPATPPARLPGAKVAFLTSVTRTGGAFGGVPGADSLCQADAVDAGLPGTFIALLATTGASAASRIPDGGWPVYRVDNALLVTEVRELATASNLMTSVSLQANGQPAPSSAFWTGSYPQGDLATSSCLNWTSSSGADQGRYGDSQRTSWWLSGGWTCNIPAALLCLQQ